MGFLFNPTQLNEQLQGVESGTQLGRFVEKQMTNTYSVSEIQYLYIKHIGFVFSLYLCLDYMWTFGMHLFVSSVSK